MMTLSGVAFSVLAMLSGGGNPLSCWVSVAEVRDKMQYQGRILSEEDTGLNYRFIVKIVGEGGNRSQISQSGHIVVRAGAASSAGHAQVLTSGAEPPHVHFEVVDDLGHWKCVAGAVTAHS